MSKKSIIRAKGRLKKIIRNPENNPVLIDTNIFSCSGYDEAGFLSFLKRHRIAKISLDELKDYTKYLSFLWSFINSEERISTVPEVIKETSGLLLQMHDLYERRTKIYRYQVKDAIMMERRTENVEISHTCRNFSKINNYISRLEKVLEILDVRSQRYKENRNLLEIEKTTKNAADEAKKKVRHYKISKADVDLVTAAFYEALFFRKTPLIISEDEDILTIVQFSIHSNNFPKNLLEKLKDRVRVYRDGECLSAGEIANHNNY